ncbi:hypothetical protein M5X02_30760 [Paenibacillus alvei]|uniref:hypothetical protein n=1 Tax=Paenibacillus alvei TaxID=44250 RepID=UPI0002898666|nr:hypothetical protein [Paenibacillus alvei]EJW14075.1 hypothetical protein PAV_141p01810 [Paenibacillus alvei DSM 29]MCY9545009.1 hypothetical protein [Paenibacillus alvei]MCY9707773.1 hypothetical protein [Paenibacillus alvei]MEC0082714.1 hypothetical protein [Paenibacillus alvei]
MAIAKCVICGCEDVREEVLHIPLKVKSTHMKSDTVPVNGSKCMQCGEQYINGKTLQKIEQIEKSIEEMEKSFNELAVGA